jgi:hypothetical protein
MNLTFSRHNGAISNKKESYRSIPAIVAYGGLDAKKCLSGTLSPIQIGHIMLLKGEPDGIS